jgi:hypothetical protein
VKVKASTPLVLKFQLLSFWKEILTVFVALGSYIAAFALVSKPKTLLGTSIAITLVGTLLTIYFSRKSRPFHFSPLTRLTEVSNWFGRGTFQLDRVNKSYKITGSEVGFCYSPTLTWDNYVLEFDFRILKQCLGVLVRASNLSNCVMLQITDKTVRPHMRVNGGWWTDDDASTRLTFTGAHIDSESWYHGRIACDHATIDFQIHKIGSDTPVVANQWEIPAGQLNITFGGKDDNAQVVLPLPINLEFGTVGFRNFDSESALVRHVLIRRL